MVEGRAELVQELSKASTDVRQHVVECVAELLANPDFNNALAGLLSQPDREPLVRARLEQFGGRTKLAGLGLKDSDVADAVAWAGNKP